MFYFGSLLHVCIGRCSCVLRNPVLQRTVHRKSFTSSIMAFRHSSLTTPKHILCSITLAVHFYLLLPSVTRGRRGWLSKKRRILILTLFPRCVVLHLVRIGEKWVIAPGRLNSAAGTCLFSSGCLALIGCVFVCRFATHAAFYLPLILRQSPGYNILSPDFEQMLQRWLPFL